MRPRARSRRSGQATLEYVLAYTGVMLPVTFAIIFTAELLWIWHSVAELTRDGARYAATRCWQPGGENVLSYMREHVPLMVDQEQFRSGQAEIEVLYLARDAETGELAEFSCEGAECSTECVPDVVTVRVTNYEFRAFLTYLGLPPVQIPDFQTTARMESAGCDPEQALCLP